MVTIVKARIDDISALQAVCQQTYTQVFAHHWTGNGLAIYLSEQFNTERLKIELNSTHFDYFFIRQNKKNIGFIKIKYQTSAELSDLDNCELEKIYILPQYSGQGIGKAVMEKVITQAKNREKRLMYLCVIDTNLNAIAFYKKLGFQFHSKTRLEALFFKEALRGMNRMCLDLIRKN